MLKKSAQLLLRFQMMLALLSLRLPRFDLILTWIAVAPSCIVFLWDISISTRERQGELLYTLDYLRKTAKISVG